MAKLSFQSYVSPYVGNANKEFDDLGTTLNKRFDDNITKYDALDSFANQLQVRGNDTHIKDGLIKDIRDVTKTIREQGDWENARIPVREVAKRVANDPILAIAQENYKREQTQRDYDNKLRQTGATIDFNQSRFNQSTIDPETGKARVLDFSGEEKVRDYYQKMNSIFEGVQADGYDTKNSSPRADPSTGMIYQIGSGSSARYISKDKIKGIAKQNLNNYLNTDEGIQRLRTLTSSNSMNRQPLDMETAKKVITNELVNTGMKRVFSQTGNENNTSITSLGGAGAGQQQQLPTQLESTAIEGGVVNPTYSELANKLKLSPSGSIRQSDNEYRGEDSPFSGMKTAEITNKSGYQTLSKEAKTDMRKIMLALNIERKDNGKYSVEGKEISAVNALEKVRKFAEERSNTAVAPSYKAFTEDEIGKAKSYVSNGNYKGRGFYSYKDKKFLNFEELPEKVKEVFNSGKTEGIQFSGVYDTDNPFRDMAKSSGRYKRLTDWVSPEKLTVDGQDFVVSSSLSDVNKADIQFRELTNIVSRANRTGVPLYIGQGKSKELVVPGSQAGLFKLKDNTGNLVYDGEFTKEQLALYMQKYNLTPED